MNVTARSISTRALRMIGKAMLGQTVSADVINDAYDLFKDMVDQWITDGLNVLVNQTEDYALTSGQQEYTIGPGGDFDRTRPVEMMNSGSVSIMQNNNPSQPLELPIELLTLEQWQAIPVKDTQSQLPMGVYYEQSYPLGKFKFWPIPNVDTIEARLYIPTPALESPFTAIDTVVNVPPGYKMALQYNLAVLLGPAYGAPIDPVIATKAAEYLADIRRINIKPVLTRVDRALIRTSDQFNWLTGNSGPSFGGN